jgi:hypothetical protein
VEEHLLDKLLALVRVHTQEVTAIKYEEFIDPAPGEAQPLVYIVARERHEAIMRNGLPQFK